MADQLAQQSQGVHSIAAPPSVPWRLAGLGCSLVGEVGEQVVQIVDERMRRDDAMGVEPVIGDVLLEMLVQPADCDRR